MRNGTHFDGTRTGRTRIMRLGLDIGGTKTAAAILHDDGSLAALRTAPSGFGGDQVVGVAASLAWDAMAEAGHGRPDSMGACMPGLVDPSTGVVRHAVNLGVETLNLAGELEQLLGSPVAVENDVKAAALGAYGILAARTADGSVPGGSGVSHDETLAYLNLGTGLAASVVRNGLVLRGPDGMLGEIGHLPVAGDTPCACGQVGCLETLTSGSALARMWTPPPGGGRDPFTAALTGDRQAREAAETLCRGVALAIQILVLSTGAHRIIIGGGLAALGPALLQGIQSELERRADKSLFLESLRLPDRFELLPADIPLAALGAAALGAAALGAAALPAAGLPRQETARLAALTCTL
ncbi:ROK family protein [Arthrobacter sp. ISL-72]|uniref:ROK family protein n=1 Tax=Arthrobacter sp. ISL-72 TaxID=2819114 RepID=UPI001BEC096A|nr:ROK family protein [Arthrobacter sp. ISL-72]MBT2593718.1 ROK family protein [Arthrobacter sp. ISL-72]